MGKPFVACREPEPPSPLSCQDISKQNGELDSVGATLQLSTESSAAPQDALQAAESYFEQVRQSVSRKSNGYQGEPKTLFESLLEEVQGEEPTLLLQTPHRKSIGEVLPMTVSGSPAELNSRVSPGQEDMIERMASLGEFSLDDSFGSLRESMVSPPIELGSRMSSARADADIETLIAIPSELSLDDSVTGLDESMGSTPTEMVPSSDGGRPEKEMIARGSNFANGEGVCSQSLDGGSTGESPPLDTHKGLVSVVQIEEVEQHEPGTVSKSEFEWRSVLRRSAKSMDSWSHDSIKMGRSAGTGSTNSRYSSSDEAISERAAAWGNGVARLVLKNSSQESTPRTSNASSVSDGLPFGQKVPGVLRHVKDALTSFQLAFVVCDVVDSEKPVLYASAGFFGMTGYSAEEVIGRNCRFLQGADTDANEVARISTALKKGEAYSGTILNYKKNGSPFWNLLTLSPITDDNGVVIKYMGMQAEVKRNSATARRKKTALDTNYSHHHRPRSISQSITEETFQPSHSQSKRSDRQDDVPIFTLPGTSRVTTTQDPNGRSQGSKRYSLTYGVHGRSSHARSRSVELGLGRSMVGGSERHSVPSEKRLSLPPLQRSAKSSPARPFYWLLTAARILEEEIHQLGFGNQNSAEEQTDTIAEGEEHKGGLKRKTKVSRVAKGVFRLFRKLERKVFKRKPRAPIPSSRVNAYNSESDLEIDEFHDIGNIDDLYTEEQKSRCDSMPHISSIRGGSALTSNLVKQAELRAQSCRYFPSVAEDRSERRTSLLGTNESVFDRKQFCIVHE